MKLNPKDHPSFFRRLPAGEMLEKGDLIHLKDAFGHDMGFKTVLDPVHFPFPTCAEDFVFRQIITQIRPQNKDAVISNLKKALVREVRRRKDLIKAIENQMDINLFPAQAEALKRILKANK